LKPENEPFTFKELKLKEAVVIGIGIGVLFFLQLKIESKRIKYINALNILQIRIKGIFHYLPDTLFPFSPFFQ